MHALSTYRPKKVQGVYRACYTVHVYICVCMLEAGPEKDSDVWPGCALASPGNKESQLKYLILFH